MLGRGVSPPLRELLEPSTTLQHPPYATEVKPTQTQPPTKRARFLVENTPASLGECIQRDAKLLTTLGFQNLVRTRRGRGDFTSLDNIRSHPAHRLLRQYARRGAPVVYSTPSWSAARIQAAVRRGPHKSAAEFQDFLAGEMLDFINKGFWLLLPYRVIRNLPGLRIAPVGVVPQHSRRPRLICDYSFHGQNADTLPIAPMEAMQFGRALERYLRRIVLADPRFGPVKMIKVDLSDGFYRIWVRSDDVPKLGMAFPSPADDPLIAFPLALPMGWTNSPPLFTAVTETIADVTNQRLLKQRKVPSPHQLEVTANSPPNDPLTLPPTASRVPWPPTSDPCLDNQRARPTAYVDVFVDDFLGLAQGNKDRLSYVRRVLLHTIDDVFRPLDTSDSPARKEPVSVKKLLQGDACWSTVKEVLGWLINTHDMTLTLTERRSQRLSELLSDIAPTQRRLSTKTWHKVLGELRSMSIALPGSRGLFGLLQEAFRSEDLKARIRLSPEVHSILNDFRWLHSNLAQRPTRLYKLVPLAPSILGAHDAAGHGAGGVLFPSNRVAYRTAPTHGLPLQARRQPQTPIVWRWPFPRELQQRLVTYSNPQGTVTNSDLELAGSVMQHEAAAQCFDVRERTIHSKTDNTATMYWARKGSATTKAAATYLLRVNSYHQRHHRYVPRHDYIPGPANTMADDASRLQHLTNDEFLTHFNVVYPQSTPWRLWTPTLSMRSALISALHSKPSVTESFLHEPKPPPVHGRSGQPSAICWPSTPYSAASKTPSPSSRSLPTGTEQGALPPASGKSDLEPSRISYGTLAKRSLAWGPKTPRRILAAPESSDWPDNSVRMPERIRRPIGSNRSPYKSSDSSSTWPTTPTTVTNKPSPT